MALRIPDGSFDFSGGVDSSKATTIQSALNPNGLPRNMLAWLMGGTVRDNGINQRNGWNLQGTIVRANALNPPLFQGELKDHYIPTDGSTPFKLVAISGNILQVDVDTGIALNLSTKFGISHPATQPYFYFVQAENFVVIQAGDGVTLPLLLYFSGGTCTSMVRSRGIISANNTPSGGVTPYNQIPAATAMCYYQQRIFYAQGNLVSGGDIRGGASGTAPYRANDAVLYVTENPLAIGGDGFAIPGQAGNIRALFYNAQLDASLGQGVLYIGTRQQIFMLQVPITRANWIAANSNNQPLFAPVQLTQGTVNDRTVVAVNSDNFYQTLLPSIASLGLQVRYFQQWGNTAISNNENRILQFVNRELQRFCSGCGFNNRLYETTLPIQTPNGVVSTAIIPLDFNIISSFNKQLPPAFEGHYEGLQTFQISSAEFGGLERCFAITLSAVGDIQLWELTSDERFDNNATGEVRVTWYAETPAFTWGKETEMKQLDGFEMWVDKVFGTVEIKLEYRPDASPCWLLWGIKQICVTHTCAEDVNTPVCYPKQPNYREGYKFPIVWPTPPTNCDPMGIRPTNIGYQFQFRITVKGWMRIRGLIPYALKSDRAPFDGLDCSNDLITGTGGSPPPPEEPVLSPANSQILPVTASVVGNGSNTVEIIVQSKDQFGNNVTVGGAGVFLTLNGPGNLTQPIDQQNGQYVAIYTAPSASGMAQITGIMNGETIGTVSGFNQSEISVMAIPASAAESTITPATASIEGNGASTTTITVTARNYSGVNIGHGGDTVLITKTSGTGTISATTDNGNGTYTATVTSVYNTFTSGTFKATMNGVQVGTQSGQSQCVVSYTALTPSIVNSSISATSPVTANGATASAITLTIRDIQGNPMAGILTVITWNKPNGASNSNLVTIASVPAGSDNTHTNVNGVCSATLTSTVADNNAASNGGGRFLSATAAGNLINSTALVNFTSQCPNATNSTVTATTPILANGVAFSVVTVTAKDPNNNPVNGITVTVASTGSNNTITYPNGQTADINGKVIAHITSTTAEAKTVSATTSGTSPSGVNCGSHAITATAPVTFT